MDTVIANDVEFAYLTWGPLSRSEGRSGPGSRSEGRSGPADAPLALCLHGFPDSAHTWRHLGPELAAAGFRVVAPFTRGYAPTSVPPDGRYQTGMLASDAIELHRALGGDERAVLIGHDWGATATWLAAAHAPDLWARVVGLAVPPGGAVGQAFLRYEQLQKSWYMFFFQHALADIVVPMNDLAFIDGLWADWSPGYDATEDLKLLKQSLSTPENLGAALGYYRATLSGVGLDPSLEAIQSAGASPPAAPTMYLHGRGDGCIGVEVADGADTFLTAPGSRVELIDDAGHFLHLEQPDVVNRLIVDFVSA